MNTLSRTEIEQVIRELLHKYHAEYALLFGSYAPVSYTHLCSAIISIVLYSILPPVSRTIPTLRAFLPLPAGFFCPQDGPELFAQHQLPLHGKADCRHAKAASRKRRQPGGRAPAAQPPRQQSAQALARPR